ncbi:MAG: GNAT family N-acetyltransferase [Acidimicrobiales bacterium]
MAPTGAPPSHPLEEIISIVQPANAASVRVAERLGFRLLRTTCDPLRDVDLDIYQLQRADWENNSGA